MNCRQCGTPFEVKPGRGRPRAYCSARCRDEAYRDRLARSVTWDERSAPVPAERVAAETLPALEALIADSEAAPPQERLARAVIETRVLAHNFRRLEPDLEPGLAWRAGEMAETIDEAVDQIFPGIAEEQK